MAQTAAIRNMLACEASKKAKDFFPASETALPYLGLLDVFEGMAAANDDAPPPVLPAFQVREFPNVSRQRHRHIIRRIGKVDPLALSGMSKRWRRLIADRNGIPRDLINHLLDDIFDSAALDRIKEEEEAHQIKLASIRAKHLKPLRQAWGDEYESSPRYPNIAETIQKEIDKEGGEDILRSWVERLVSLTHDLLSAIPDDDLHILHLIDIDEDEIHDTAKEWSETWSEMVPANRRNPNIRRKCCERWQRRRLRRRLARLHIAIASLLGLTGTRARSKYLSRESLEVYRGMRFRCEQWAAEARVRNTRTGDDIGSVAEIKEGTRNHSIYATYAMLKGVELWAARAGMVCLFVTMTLPPEWHPLATNEPWRRTPWNRLPLKAACENIQLRWSNFRKYANSEGIILRGAQFREPQQDGTPHIHALLFMRPDERGRAVRMARRAFGHHRRAVKVIRIDNARGTARNYVTKYLMKGIDGGGAAADPETVAADRDRDQLEHHDAVRGWASFLGVRQFSFLGIRGGRGTWQAMYRRRADDGLQDHPAATAMRERRYDDALVALGFLPEPERPVAACVPRARIVYEPTRTQYGDVYMKPMTLEVDGYGLFPLKSDDFQIVTDSTPRMTVSANLPRVAVDTAPTEQVKALIEITRTRFGDPNARERGRQAAAECIQRCQRGDSGRRDEGRSRVGASPSIGAP